MIISPTEPPQIRALGSSSSTPESYGADILIISPKPTPTRTGIQRKKFPDDLVSSLADGRLYSQLPKMATLDRAVLILEGHGKWTLDGELLDKYARFTKPQLYGLINTILWEFGVHVQVTNDIRETVEWLRSLEHWLSKPKHNSLKSRPGAQRNSWGKVTEDARALHLLQGLDGVKAELARRIFEHFGRVPIKWDCTVEDLMQIRGIGKVKAERIWNSLGGGD